MAQDIAYQSSTGRSNVPVSEAQPLPVGSVSGSETPVAGGGQMTSLSSAVGLSSLGTIPPTAKRVLLQAEDQDIRWRDDGTDPTTSVGMKLEARQTIEYSGDLSAIRFIAVVAGAKLNVLYYR